MIVVLGMHRSARRHYARLQVMGVGSAIDWCLPLKVTTQRFLEDIDLNALNIEMLSAIDNMVSFVWYWLNRCGDFTQGGYFLRAAELLRQKVSSTPIYGSKTACSKLLPSGKRCLTTVNRCELCHGCAPSTQCGQVVGQTWRNWSRQSYLLWLVHVITVWRQCGEKRVLVDYDAHAITGSWVESVSKHLNLKSIDGIQNYKTDFLDKGYAYGLWTEWLLLDDNCPRCRDVYAVCLGVHPKKQRLMT